MAAPPPRIPDVPDGVITDPVELQKIVMQYFDFIWVNTLVFIQKRRKIQRKRVKRPSSSKKTAAASRSVTSYPFTSSGEEEEQRDADQPPPLAPGTSPKPYDQTTHPLYKVLKSACAKKLEKLDQRACRCKPAPLGGEKCAGVGCPMRKERVECPPPCKCHNQRILNKDITKRLTLGCNNKYNMHVKTKEMILRGEVACEYAGEVTKGRIHQNQLFAYPILFNNNKNLIYVNCSKTGNQSRYLAHSDTPNCVIQEWIGCDEMLHLLVVANDTINAMDVLTIRFPQRATSYLLNADYRMITQGEMKERLMKQIEERLQMRDSSEETEGDKPPLRPLATYPYPFKVNNPSTCRFKGCFGRKFPSADALAHHYRKRHEPPLPVPYSSESQPSRSDSSTAQPSSSSRRGRSVPARGRTARGKGTDTSVPPRARKQGKPEAQPLLPSTYVKESLDYFPGLEYLPASEDLRSKWQETRREQHQIHLDWPKNNPKKHAKLEDDYKKLRRQVTERERMHEAIAREIVKLKQEERAEEYARQVQLAQQSRAVGRRPQRQVAVTPLQRGTHLSDESPDEDERPTYIDPNATSDDQDTDWE